MLEILAVTTGCFTLGAALLHASTRRLAATVRRARWTKFWVYFAVVNGVVVFGYLGRSALLLLVVSITTIGAVEIDKARRIAVRKGRRISIWVWVPYAAIALGSITSAAISPPTLVIYVFLVVAAFDGGSQVIGQLIGRHALAPSLSPRKTIEGLIGGLIIALAVAVLLRNLAEVGAPVAALLGLAMGVVGLAGDLSASWVKRRAAIKNYSNILPGHGGVLDRFDAFLPNCALISIAWMASEGLP
jgi:phosphatidate cytidylyltransferase